MIPPRSEAAASIARRHANEQADLFETGEISTRVHDSIIRDPLLANLAAASMEIRKAAIHRRDSDTLR